jgi:hypothetical protein
LPSPKRATIERNIKRLQREIDEIDRAFYFVDGSADRFALMGMLERKRDDIVRGAVLQLHTSIEDLLDQLILYRVLDITEPRFKSRLRGDKAKALRKMLRGASSIGFDMKLNFALGIGLLNTAMSKKLIELNSIRNRCSHNWLLKSVVRHGKRPAQKKLPLLLWRGRDLHSVTVLKEFLYEFGRAYLWLFSRWVS